MILQPIVDLVALLATKGIKNAIISPGSRNAPLTIALARHPSISSKSISDERSAGFIALGMAQILNEPVALCCTSGSAVFNYAPAVAEAFFQEVPLVILSADRPKEWIHQHDGQTIYQQDIFGKHVKKSFSLSADYQHKDAQWEINRLVNEAINLANSTPKGPVHINIPLREPFYPEYNEVMCFGDVRNIQFVQSEKCLSQFDVEKLVNLIVSGKKVLIAIGQNALDIELVNHLKELSICFNIPIVGDIISNLGDDFIVNQDLFCSILSDDYIPDVLITSGQSFISKSLKTFFRKNNIPTHIHFQESQLHIDTFQSITHLIDANFKTFIRQWILSYESIPINNIDRTDYAIKWNEINAQAKIKKKAFFLAESVFNEFSVIHSFLNSIPANSILHLANSMSVRYANHISLPTHLQIEVFANRGTSGIDGCLSTAVGSALATDKLVFLVIGDVAFFYDRNALWNNHLPKNLRILLLNNHGGGIFRIIDGPNKQPELEEYFETLQVMNAKNTAIDAGLKYVKVRNDEEFTATLPHFIKESSQSFIIEVESNSKLNTDIFEKFKKK